MIASHNGEPSQTHTVRRAIEIIARQLHCDERTALDALDAIAVAADETLENVAEHVLEGTVRFDP